MVSVYVEWSQEERAEADKELKALPRSVGLELSDG